MWPYWRYQLIQALCLVVLWRSWAPLLALRPGGPKKSGSDWREAEAKHFGRALIFCIHSHPLSDRGVLKDKCPLKKQNKKLSGSMLTKNSSKEQRGSTLEDLPCFCLHKDGLVVCEIHSTRWVVGSDYKSCESHSITYPPTHERGGVLKDHLFKQKRGFLSGSMFVGGRVNMACVVGSHAKHI